ncbi:MAG: aminoacyl-tRNA hydrolase [Phycisphaeraceae bacterium]|nr:aminoacyl-tRNA hydrolase [Phycisphaerae bacterium]MBX3393542.1 aminoacyl-tRNA hydrolase [Phycisphaeraceae bacterium]
MKMIIGLGNPGIEYARTRHNVGFMVVERLIGRLGVEGVVRSRFHSACVDASIAGEKCLLLRPTTYMNRSGLAAAEAIGFFKVDPSKDVMVVADDLALPTGMIRLRSSGGSGGQKGLDDITRALGTDAYPRLRVGVGMQPSGGKPAVMNQADFVLSRFIPEESPLLEKSVGDACSAIETFVAKGLDSAMNAFNVRNNPSRDVPGSGDGRDPDSPSGGRPSRAERKPSDHASSESKPSSAPE